MTSETETNINEAIDWLQQTGGSIQSFAVTFRQITRIMDDQRRTTRRARTIPTSGPVGFGGVGWWLGIVRVHKVLSGGDASASAFVGD